MLSINVFQINYSLLSNYMTSKVIARRSLFLLASVVESVCFPRLIRSRMLINSRNFSKILYAVFGLPEERS
jgi:hypothetical protein